MENQNSNAGEHAASGSTQSEEVTTRIITPEGLGCSKPEVSASTIGMMLGLATSKEIQIIENRLELLTQKVSTVTTKIEKLLGLAQAMPTGSDLERIDVQIGGLKSMVRDVLAEFAAKSGDVQQK